MPWFWFTSDGHYYFNDGNNNFNAIVMIVIIMLGTHSSNIFLWSSSAGSERADFKGVIYLTVECRALLNMWAIVFFLVNFYLIVLVNIGAAHYWPAWWLRGWTKRFPDYYFSLSYFYSCLWCVYIVHPISPLRPSWQCALMTVWISLRKKITHI